MSNLEKAARQALAVLEDWQNPRESGVEEHKWPIHWTLRNSVTVTLVPRMLSNKCRASTLISLEMAELGRQHNMAIDALRAALAQQAEPVVWDPQCPLCGGSRPAAIAQQAEPVVDDGGNASF